MSGEKKTKSKMNENTMDESKTNENPGAMEKTRGIIGRIYDELNSVNLFPNTKEFIEFLTQKEGCSISNACWAEIAKKDYFTKTLTLDISEFLDDEEEFESELKETFNNNDNLKNLLNPRLTDILITVNTYEVPNRGIIFYNPELKEQLLSYLQVTKDNFSIERNIYLLVYFAVRKTLPANFYFGYGYRQQLNEFNDKIICRYGVNSKPGTRAIIELAENGNIFALYEYADMLYYGNSFVNVPDYEKAISYYQKAAGLNKISNQIKNKGLCNPLALWSLSYIYFNYHRRVELAKADNIIELDRLTSDERIEVAIQYAKWAIGMTSCAPAENILGVISRYLGKSQQRKYNLKSPLEYFNNAKEHDYIYAYNNVASVELDLIFTDPTNETAHLDAYIKNLTISAKKMEPYAANTLGKFFLSGTVKTEIDNCAYEHTYAEYINPQTAKECFHYGISSYMDGNSAWAYANLIVFFPNDYKNNIELLADYFKHCCKLKNLNPLVFLHENISSIEPLGEASISFLEELIKSLGGTIKTVKQNAH